MLLVIRTFSLEKHSDLAVPDSWVANMDIVFKPVMRWLFTLCGLPIARPSTTILLVRAPLSRIALNSSSVATSLPSLTLVSLPGLVPFPLLSFLNLYILFPFSSVHSLTSLYLGHDPQAVGF